MFLITCAVWLFCSVESPKPPQQPLGGEHWARHSASPYHWHSSPLAKCGSEQAPTCNSAWGLFQVTGAHDLWEEQARNAGELMSLGAALNQWQMGSWWINTPALSPLSERIKAGTHSTLSPKLSRVTDHLLENTLISFFLSAISPPHSPLGVLWGPLPNKLFACEYLS